MAKAIHGAGEIEVPGGMAVGRLREALGPVLNLSPDAVALVNGCAVQQHYIVRDGDNLEFSMPSGRKGVGEHVWTEEQFFRFFQITSDDLRDWISKGLKVGRCCDGSIRITATAVDEFLRGHKENDLPVDSACLASDLLTEEEAVRYLRLDTIQIANPQETLRRYREQGLLRGTQVSKRVFYRRCELDQFLARITDQNPR